MKKVFIVYNTDAWHTRESQTFEGAFEDKEHLIQQLRKRYKLSDHQVYLLRTIGQTQSDDKDSDNYDGEFIIHEHVLNALEED